MRSRRFRFVAGTWTSALALGATLLACAAEADTERGQGDVTPGGGDRVAIHLTSTAFAEGSPIPPVHTCDGDDTSPALAWSGIPEGAASLALICDDPDAPVGTWVHWVLYDLPASISELPTAIPTSATLPSGAKQGTNDFRRLGYGGPCPPRGGPHRYFFRIYALDRDLKLDSGARKADVERAMEGHVLSEGRLMGTYQRR